MKKFYEVMKKAVVNAIGDIEMELLEIEAIQQTDKQTGEIKNSVRCTCEIPKNNGTFSRSRITVKIPDTDRLKVTQQQLEDGEYWTVKFDGLQITFISQYGDVYFKAEDYSINQKNA